jgi:putative membrane protein
VGIDFQEGSMLTLIAYDHHHWHHGGPWFLFIPLFWIAMFAIVCWALGRHRWRHHPAHWAQVADARAVLDLRYARGEIGTDEYQERLNQLGTPGAGA